MKTNEEIFKKHFYGAKPSEHEFEVMRIVREDERNKYNRCLEKLREYNDGNNDLEDCVDKILAYVRAREAEQRVIVCALEGYLKGGSMADLEAFVQDLRDMIKVDEEED